MLNIQCCCGGRYRCEECRKDICFCSCHAEVDPTPQDRESVTAGWAPTTHELAYQEKQEAHA